MCTICIIDDDAFIREAIETLLESDGFDVKSFSSAREFVEANLLGGIDCVLTDVEMPGGMTGLDLLSQASKNAPECPVLVMSGRGDAFRASAYALGARDYLMKPFSAEELIEAIFKATHPAVKALHLQ
jgi:FixJ family two-component response regulator